MRDWRSRQRRAFHVYSPGFIAGEAEPKVDSLCEDAVSGAERLVDLVMQGRAGAAAWPD